MDIEIIISGICSCINLDTQDATIIGPSVMILKADHHMQGVKHDAADNPEQPGESPAVPENDEDYKKDCDCVHIPFIAFDSRNVSVDNSSEFRPVDGAPQFKFLRLDGVELRIQGDDVGIPILDPTYGNVVSREMYWPEAKGQWNHDVVPRVGQRPKKNVVSAFMKFGGGTIAGGRLCPFKWKFAKLNDDTFSRHFAEEIIYKFEEPERDQVTIKLHDIEDETLVRTLIFRRLYGEERLTLFLGNSTQKGMKTSVRRRRPNNEPGDGYHFAFFHRVVDVGGEPIPPLPEGIEPPEPAGTGGGGGASGGICGPKIG